MYTLSIIALVVLVVLLLPAIIIGFYLKKHYKNEIKEIIQYYKDMKPDFPSFKKTKVDVKNLLTELKKQKSNLNK